MGTLSGPTETRLARKSMASPLLSSCLTLFTPVAFSFEDRGWGVSVVYATLSPVWWYRPDLPLGRGDLMPRRPTPAAGHGRSTYTLNILQLYLYARG